MPLKFIPGNINKPATQIIKHGIIDSGLTENCRCRQDEITIEKKTLIYPQESINVRVSQIVRSYLGGRTQFGDLGIIAEVDIIGRREGQPGGIVPPLRNRF